jgi:hypothetical protein
LQSSSMENTLSEVLQTALGIVLQQWCDKTKIPTLIRL